MTSSSDCEGFIEIHTGDRGTFKRCRRKWGWGSNLRDNLVITGQAEPSPLWLGSGFHWSMEDYFGHRRFGHPVDAFEAYLAAGKPEELPDNVDDDAEMARGMIGYYIDDWLPRHPEPYETLWVDGTPQVEVEVSIDITDLLSERAQQMAALWCKKKHRSDIARISPHKVFYVTTFDRVVVDTHDRLWGVDYKTAANFDQSFLPMNPQVGAYDWAMSVYYGDDQVEGLIWQQHLKAVPEQPRIINGKRKGELAISQDKRQYTSYSLYKKAVIAMFGEVPNEYVEMLNFLAESESVEGDRFIRRDPLHRNAAQRRAVQEQIILEVEDMLNPDLPLYPNPTRDCSWDCPFKAPCQMTDDGSDAVSYIREEYTQWAGYRDDWRQRIKFPEKKEKKRRATR